MFFYEILPPAKVINNPYDPEDKWRKFRLFCEETRQLPKENDFRDGIYVWRDEDVPGVFGDGLTRIFVDAREVTPNTSGGIADITVNNILVPQDAGKFAHLFFDSGPGLLVQTGTQGEIKFSLIPGKNVSTLNNQIDVIDSKYVQGTGVKLTQISTDPFNPTYRIDSDLAGITDVKPIKVTSAGPTSRIELLYNDPLYNNSDYLDIRNATQTQRGVIKYDGVTLKRNTDSQLTAVKATDNSAGLGSLGTVIPDGDTITEDASGIISATLMRPGKALIINPTDKYKLDVQYDDKTIKEASNKQLYLNKDDETIIYEATDQKVEVNFDGKNKTKADDVSILFGSGNDGTYAANSLYVRQADSRTVDASGTETYKGIRGTVIPDGDTITMNATTGVISGTKVTEGNALRYRTTPEERHVIDVITDTDMHAIDPLKEKTIKVNDAYVFGATNSSYITVNKDNETIIYDVDDKESLIVNIDGRKDKADLHRTLAYDATNLVHLNADSIAKPTKQLDPAGDQYNPTIYYNNTDDYVYISKATNQTYNELVKKQTVKEYGEAGVVFPDGKTLSVDAKGMIYQDNITVYNEAKKTFEFGDSWHTPSAEAVIQYVNQLDTFTIEQCTTAANTPVGYTWKKYDIATTSIITITGTLEAEDVTNKKTTFLVPEFVVDDPSGPNETYNQVIPTYVKTETGLEYWDWVSVGSTEIKLDKYVENINTIAGVKYYEPAYDTNEKDKNIQSYELGTELFKFVTTQVTPSKTGAISLAGPSIGGISIYDDGALNTAGEKMLTVKSDLYNYIRQKGDVLVPDKGIVIGNVGLNVADGLNSIAAGNNTSVQGNNAFAFGDSIAIGGNNSFAVGEGHLSATDDQFACGKNSIDESGLIAIVGNGVSTANRNNSAAIGANGFGYFNKGIYVNCDAWDDASTNYGGTLIAPVVGDKVEGTGDVDHTTKVIVETDISTGDTVARVHALLPYVDSGCLKFKFRV